jgi:exopolysaccharide biosynthesis polyprenyl glycosylphosphotransferase
MFARLRRLTITLVVMDAILVQAALIMADFVRRFLPFGQPLPPEQTLLNPILHFAVAVIFPVTFFALSVYDLRQGATPVGDPVVLLRAVGVATFVFAGVLYFSFRDVSRLLVIYIFFWTLALMTLLRLLAGLGLRLLRKRGRVFSRILLVGAGEIAGAVARALRARLGDAVLIVGCLDDEAATGPDHLPVLGKIETVREVVRAHQVDEIIVALPSDQHATIERIEYELLTEPLRLRFVPDYMRLVFVQSSVESLDGIPLIGLREPRINGMAWAIKRVFDVVVATLLLLVTSPFLVIIAIAIKLDSPGPVIFRQRRVGENGRLFWVHKFRTMVADAEQRQPMAGTVDGQPIYKTPDDARVTRLGRFLRRMSLDELPQLFNVLTGEMSLVGPRPEQQFIVDRYEPWQRQRLSVPPGITGWWQVNGRSDLPMHLNTHLDLYYIRNYSLWLDLFILWKTAGAVIRRQGAF